MLLVLPTLAFGAEFFLHGCKAVGAVAALTKLLNDPVMDVRLAALEESTECKRTGGGPKRWDVPSPLGRKSPGRRPKEHPIENAPASCRGI